MHSPTLEQQNVDEVMDRVPEARATLRSYKIATTHLPLDVMAAAHGVTTEELLAVMDYQARKHARRERDRKLGQEL